MVSSENGRILMTVFIRFERTQYNKVMFMAIWLNSIESDHIALNSATCRLYRVTSALWDSIQNKNSENNGFAKQMHLQFFFCRIIDPNTFTRVLLYTFE